MADVFQHWLIPLLCTAGLAVWVYRGGKSASNDPGLIRMMRAGGAIPLSAAIWLIWWLANY